MKAIIRSEEKLREISTDVESVEEAQELIKKLEKELSKHENGIGLSAIQIGIPKRVAIVKEGHYEPFIHIINPEIIEENDIFTHVGEGCLSFPGKLSNVPRYKHFIINNKVIDGDEFRIEKQYFYYSEEKKESEWNSGIQAIAVQHEIDHFDGKLIIDHSNKPISNKMKVGRNDPCPCGSTNGQGNPVKYKKCCGK